MKRFQANTEDAAWRIVDGEAVIVHATTSAYYGLNATGTHVWESIAASPMTLEEVSALVSGRYGLPESDVRTDVESFLDRLRAEGLLMEAEGPAPALEVSIGAESVQADTYTPPEISPFGELEQLILSGE